MQISPEGIRLIKSFEGYHTRLPNGDCAAYLCPANVPTIGYGCTENVKIGMVWTEAQAEAELRRELAKHEAAVTRLATVDLNQNEFDALVSFSYNCGAGALGKSTLLKRLNKGDRLGAAQQFGKWTRGGGRVLRGLVSRREREAALFLKPVEAPEVPYMPQQVGKVIEVTPGQATAAGAGAGATAGLALPALPPVPSLSYFSGLRGFADEAAGLTAWAWANPGIVVACCAWIGGTMYWPQIKSYLGKWRPA